MEGGYSNHPSDSGGKTMFGITEKVARSHDYNGEMSDITIDIVQSIYHKDYWLKNNLDKVAELSESVAFEVFDTAVNIGSESACKFLQRSLNLFNKGGSDNPIYEDLKVDGIIGDATLNALSIYHSRRLSLGLDVLIKTLNVLQGGFYIRLAEKDVKYENFIYGWINNRVKI